MVDQIPELQLTPGGRRVSITKAQRESEVGAELLSLCQTATIDGSLSDEEVGALRAWLAANAGQELPAIQFLTPVVERIVADGMVTPEERRDLFMAIEKVLPQDVREMSRTARRLREQADKREAKESAGAAKREAREEVLRSRPIESFDFMIAGARYDGRPAVIATHVRVPDSVLLVRDRENAHSRNAVKVVTTGGHQFGFVPEEDALVLAPLLDADHPYTAKVKKILNGSSHDIPVIVAECFGHKARVAGTVRPGPAPSVAPGITVKGAGRLSKAVVAIIAVLVVIAVARGCSA